MNNFIPFKCLATFASQKKVGFAFLALSFFCLFTKVFAQTAITTQVANMDATVTQNVIGSSFAGTYNNGAELANFANQNSGSNTTPGAAAFRTFTTNQAATGGTARPLRPGDRFLITAFANTPATSGVIGISFKNNTTYTNVSDYVSGQVCRFELTDGGTWTVVHGGGTINTGATSGADIVLRLDITSSNTFNATVAGATYHNLSFINAGTVASFCIYNIVTTAAVNRSNPNSFWKNASLQGRQIDFGGTTNVNITGNITNGGNENSVTLSATNAVFAGTNNITLTPSTANTYTGTTTISGGTVTLGAANALPNTAINLNGGTLSTGTGFDETLGVLTLGASSAITLGNAAHNLNFAASNAASWTGTLTINNWTPSSGKVFFGNTNTGLTATQLSNINFTGFGTGAKILSTGEIVPNLYFISVATGNYNTASTWLTNTVPGPGAYVYIANSHNVTLDVNPTLTVLNIQAGGTFTASDASPRTLTFNRAASGTSLVNAGTWVNGAGGSTVSFTSSNVSQDIVHTLTGTYSFNHVNVTRTVGSFNVGVQFSSASTINGDFTINLGGFVNTTPPAYGTSSNLIYNTGASYTIFAEWTAGATSGAGYPNNVVIGSTVANSGLNINTGLVYHLRGNLTIAGSNSSLTIASAQLNIGGNWINNSTAVTSFIKGTSTVIFTGSGNHTIGGTNVTANGYDFYNLTGSKSGGGSIVFNSLTRVTNILNVTSGTLSTNGVSLSLVALNGTAGAILNNGSATNATITITDGANNNCAAAIQDGSTGSLGIVKNGTGNQILSGANTYGGATTASGGTLTIGSTVLGSGLSANSNYTFGGANLVFANMPAASILNAGTINLQANTNITLTGPNAYTINFAASNLVAWDLTRTLTIFNWTPSAGRIINLGTTTGLTYPPAFPNPNNQVSRINFDNYGVGAKLAGIELRPAFLYVTQATGLGDYNTPASWLLGDRPVLNNGTESIFVQGTFTLNFTAASPILNVLRAEIASGAVLNIAAGERINIYPTGDFRVNGTINMTGNSLIDLQANTNFQLGGTINMQSASKIDFAAGISLIATSPTANFSNQGTLDFLGAFTITANSPNTILLPNVNLRASVNFGNNSTIRAGAALNMLSGGFVNTNAPVYAPGSRLVYNTGGPYNRGTEWSATSGKGYPDSVLIVNTALNLNAGASGVRKMGGSLTIQSGGEITMMGGTLPDSLTVTGNVSVFGTLKLGSVIGCDLRIGGNYYSYAGNTVWNNNRAVWFTNGTQDQFIQRIGDSNPVFFDFLVVDKPGYTLRLTAGTNAYIISPVNNDLTLRILQMRNGDFDMNDGIFTMEGNNENSMNVFVDNGVRRIFTSTGTGEFRIRGTNATGIAKFGVIPDAPGTDRLLFDNNVEVSTTVGCNFGVAGTTTVNAILRIDQFGYVVFNSPDYGSSSTLIYNNGIGGYKRNMEWNTDNPGTTGAGFPHNIIVQNNTLVELNSTDFPATFPLGCSGDFTIQNGSSVTTAAMAHPISVGGNFNLNGTLTLSTNAAGVFNVGGNWARSSTGVFVQNNRNVNFNGTASGILTASNGQTFSFMTLNKSNASASLTISDNVAITDSLGLRQGKLVLNNKGISIVSTATKTARVGVSQMQGGDITYTGTLGKFFVERYMPARRSWRLMTAPFETTGSATISEAWQEGQARDYSTPAAASASTTADTATAFGTQITGGSLLNGFDLGFTNNPSIRFYNAGAWASPANTNATTVNSREGWMLFVRGDRKNFGQITSQFKAPTITTLRPRGQLFLGNKSITSAAGGLTVVGNPYASPVDFNTVQRTGSGWPAQPTYTVWDPYLGGNFGAGGWVALTWNGTRFAKTVTSNVDSVTIPSGAAIMVNFPVGGTLTFREQDKAGTMVSTAFRTSRNTIQTNLLTVLDDSSTFVSDGNLIQLGDDCNDAVDENDLEKLNNFSENFGLRRSGKVLMIERKKLHAQADTIFYNLAQMRIKNYLLQVNIDDLNSSQMGIVPVLEDNYTNTKTNLKLNAENRYRFNVINEPASYAPDRLRIVFKPTVQFLQLQAEATGADIAVQWKVAHEYNLDRYEVERSTDGVNFVVATDVAASAGQAPTAWYSFTDREPATAVYYYRIKAYSYSGSYLYSNVVKVNRNRFSNNIYVYPNPVSLGQINLQMGNQPTGIYQTRLLTTGGQLLQANVINHTSGTSTQTILLRKKPIAGIYQLEVLAPGKKPEVLSVVIE